MNKTIRVENRIVGEDEPCFIIAEAGINHNGNLKIAKKLVDIAVSANADAVKFQTFKESEINRKDIANITYDETMELKKYCDDKNITFFSTPHSFSAIDFLNELVPIYKIASKRIIENEFVKQIASKQKPIIASTGSIKNKTKVATDEEVSQFLSLVDTSNLVLLYCISSYPCYDFEPEKFVEFKNKYSYLPVGFSFHSKDIKYSLQAVKLGACVVEQHITIADDFECPDKQVSLNPEKLKQLVAEIRRYKR